MSVIKFNNQSFHVDLVDEVDQSVANEIFKFREYRSAEETIKNAKEVILDIGAHIGLFAIYTRALNQAVEIFCLEPEPHNFKRLQENVNDNKLENIICEKLALAKETGTQNLFLSADSHNHSLLENNSAKTLSVKTVSLADYLEQRKIKKIALLKMDIEGGEMAVIDGLNSDLCKKIKAILLEYHDSQEKSHLKIETKLRELGFSVQSEPSKFDKRFGYILARNKRV